MQHLFLDCSHGMSGDMTLASLAHLGVDLSPLPGLLAQAGVACRLEVWQEERGGGPGCRVEVSWEAEGQPLRHPADIAAIFAAVPVADRVRHKALAVLEALTLAMRSDFVQEGDKKRHVIVLFTDEEAHSFEDREALTEEAAKLGCTPELYPENMPEDYKELANAWAGNEETQTALGVDGQTKLDRSGRRLVIFAPDAYPWTDMEMEWENVIRVSMEQGGSGEDLDMADVYSMIAHSLSN